MKRQRRGTGIKISERETGERELERKSVREHEREKEQG